MNNFRERILITSTDVMMIQFLVPHVLNLHENGFKVDIACSSANGYERDDYFSRLRQLLPEEVTIYKIPLNRKPYKISNYKGLLKLREIINQNHYKLVWTNEPVMGVMTRLASISARRRGTVVLYMAHGYHFFQGAPIINWTAYPIEKVMSYFCDYICLINWEDYYFTKSHMSNVGCYHIDGIGFDNEKFSKICVNRNDKRKSIGIKASDFMLLSVGELQRRKNHEVVIKAIAKLNNKSIKYVICGWGELHEYLKGLSEKLGVIDQVFFLGHRYDVAEILKCADVFVHPSQREGLGIAALEAMASGLPLITSDVQGIKDYMINGKTGFMCNPDDVDKFVLAIKTLYSSKDMRKEIGINNITSSAKYNINKIQNEIIKIINNIKHFNN